jgi:hypothetical protein
MADTIIFDVDLASNFKALVINNDGIVFANNSLKDAILKADDNNFLMVKKKIGSSITILSVDLVNDDLLKAIL